MIGIFDSGFGGLTVLREIVQMLPHYTYLYLGDNARAPYGDRTKQVIYQYTQEAVQFLASKGCTLIIIACNTASSEALRLIQREFLPTQAPSVKVLGVIRPTVEIAIEKTKIRRIGVIATRATITSGAYERELHHLDTSLVVYQQACPLLVPLIEEGWDRKPETRMILKKYLLPLKSKHIDALILGCTHYPIMEREIKRKMGRNVMVISSARSTAEKLVDYLHRHPELEKRLEKKSSIRFFTTDDQYRFLIHGQRFFQSPIHERNVETVHLSPVA